MRQKSFKKCFEVILIPNILPPLGAPLSNATLGDDGVWRRSFAHGTNVTFDTNTETGTVEWAKTG